MGDGVHDDADAISAALTAAAAALLAGGGAGADAAVVFLPKGVYRIGHTLSIPQGVALVGTAHHLCVLIPTKGFSDAVGRQGGRPVPLVRMLGRSNQTNATQRTGGPPGSTLSQLMMAVFNHAEHISAWEWEAEGEGNVLRQCATWILSPMLCAMGALASDCPYPGDPPQDRFSSPMTTIKGGGAGRFYVVHHEDAWYENPGCVWWLFASTSFRSHVFRAPASRVTV
jgi:hypothetical protein